MPWDGVHIFECPTRVFYGRGISSEVGSRLAELGRIHKLPKLSMGMSHDLEAAIEEGATHIRIGTALFGPRRKD